MALQVPTKFKMLDDGSNIVLKSSLEEWEFFKRMDEAGNVRYLCKSSLSKGFEIYQTIDGAWARARDIIRMFNAAMFAVKPEIVPVVASSNKDAITKTLERCKHFGSFELRVTAEYHIPLWTGLQLTQKQIVDSLYGNRAHFEKILGGRFSIRKDKVNGYQISIERNIYSVNNRAPVRV